MPANTPYNNYAFTKLMTEQMLEKLALADQRWSIALFQSDWCTPKWENW